MFCKFVVIHPPYLPSTLFIFCCHRNKNYINVSTHTGFDQKRSCASINKYILTVIRLWIFNGNSAKTNLCSPSIRYPLNELNINDQWITAIIQRGLKKLLPHFLQNFVSSLGACNLQRFQSLRLSLVTLFTLLLPAFDLMQLLQLITPILLLLLCRWTWFKIDRIKHVESRCRCTIFLDSQVG